jgi:hypothetical protein
MKTYWYGLLVVSSTLAACSSALIMPTPTVASTATRTPAMASTATQTPTMAPTATVEPTKPPIDPASNFPTGKFEAVGDELSIFEFTAEGRWVHYYDGSRLAAGAFGVEGDTYIQKTVGGRGPSNCPVPMTYKFSFDGTYLKFELTDESRNDPCGDRSIYYNNTTYVFAK